jgi:hypothetical protein
MKYIFILLSLLFTFSIQAQIINIPDVNFKAKLIALGVDDNGNGEIEMAETVMVSTLFLQNSNISSLEGIQYFTELDWLDCSGNNISDLSVLNSFPYFYTLECSNNNLTNLDLSNFYSITNLYCSYNQLTSLDLSNTLYTVMNVVAANNNLITLNIKNGTAGVNGLYIENNPNLSHVCVNDNQEAFYVSYFQSASTTQVGVPANIAVNSYCNFTPGGNYFTINGTAHFDADSNGCSVLDSGYANFKVAISNGTTTLTTLTNTGGFYETYVPAGNYTITPQIENSSYFTVTPVSATVDFPTQASPFAQDFCVTANGIYHDLEVAIVPIGVARPGFDASYKIQYKNKGTQTENANLVFNYNDLVMDYLTASTNPTSQNTGALNWNLGTLQPFQTGSITVNFNLNTPTESPALNGGDVLPFSSTINGLFTDETPSDNTFILNQTVVNSYDPNDKTCLEGVVVDQNKIGDYLHYQIRFENTGTYPAQNIVVRDTIDATKFDISTLEMVNASHNCKTKITDDKVEFIFENINLPFNDATNDGYIVFKIKTKSTLTVGESVSNTASIYFDYNFPIVTNTATSAFQNLSSEDFSSENKVLLYPNPVKNTLFLTSKNNIDSIIIYDIQGRKIQDNIVNSNELRLDTNGLIKGCYFIEIIFQNEKMTKKFIKQ